MVGSPLQKENDSFLGFVFLFTLWFLMLMLMLMLIVQLFPVFGLFHYKQLDPDSLFPFCLKVGLVEELSLWFNSDNQLSAFLFASLIVVDDDNYIFEWWKYWQATILTVWKKVADNHLQFLNSIHTTMT